MSPLVRLLIQPGADVNLAADSCFVVFQEGQDAVMRLLIQQGADVNLADGKGRSGKEQSVFVSRFRFVSL